MPNLNWSAQFDTLQSYQSYNWHCKLSDSPTDTHSRGEYAAAAACFFKNEAIVDVDDTFAFSLLATFLNLFSGGPLLILQFLLSTQLESMMTKD